MKKLVIGCGLLLLLVGAGLAAAAYYVYRQVAPTVAQFSELAQIPELEREIRNRDPFEPPASHELTDSQIEKLVKIQSDVRRRIGERMAAFEQKYKELAEQQEGSLLDAAAVLQAYADLTKTWIDAKRAQVEALNASGLSLDEYEWIRDQAYRALGQPFLDLNASKLLEDARRGVPPEAADQVQEAVNAIGSEANRKRIEKVRQFLEENLALVSFGL